MKETVLTIELEGNELTIIKNNNINWLEILGTLIRMEDFVRDLMRDKPQQPIIISNDILKVKKN